MKFGLFGINMGPCSRPETMARVAEAAEGAGFDSVWTGEHVVLPDPRVPPSPLPPDYPMLDPAVALAFVAARTKKLLLGTGIIILPQRNPLVLAKELASVDVLSGGRLVFGLGIGYLKPEFDALGIPFEEKGARSMEYLHAILTLWTQPKPAYKGRFVSFGGVQALPQPMQKPHPPVVIGGASEPAFRRAVRYGDGWYGFALDLDAASKCVAGLREASQEAGPRVASARSAELEISVTPSGAVDLDTARRFADIGVHRLILFARARDEREALAFIAEAERSLIGRV